LAQRLDDAYNAAYSDYTQKLDTVSMMGYLASVSGSLLYPWFGAPLAVAAYVFYWKTETDSQISSPERVWATV